MLKSTDLTDRGVIQRGKLADLIGIIGNPFNNPLAFNKSGYSNERR